MSLHKYLDILASIELGARGNTLAHYWLQDAPFRMRSPHDHKTLKYKARYGGLARIFTPPKEEDRVIMFSDGSGAYVFADGFATPMGNIKEEATREVAAGRWKEE